MAIKRDLPKFVHKWQQDNDIRYRVLMKIKGKVKTLAYFKDVKKASLLAELISDKIKEAVKPRKQKIKIDSTNEINEFLNKNYDDYLMKFNK